MTTKLTLTLEKTVIDRAKYFAKHTGRSLSELIENYLEKITQEEQNTSFSTKLQKLVGSVHLPDDFDEKREIRIEMEKKHFK